MNEPFEERLPCCPVCRSERATRAVVMDADYRCPDCSALFEANGHVSADPRLWIEPRLEESDVAAPGTNRSTPAERWTGGSTD